MTVTTRSRRWWTQTANQTAIDAACNELERILTRAHLRMDRLGYPTPDHYRITP